MLLIFMAAMLAILLWPAKRDQDIALWYAVDADGTACLYFAPPVREPDNNVWYPTDKRGFIEADGLSRELPNMTWEDEPLEVTIAIQDRHVHQ